PVTDPTNFALDRIPAGPIRDAVQRSHRIGANTVKDPARSTALLGDTTARDYAHKLNLFNSFAQPELRRAIADLDLKPGMRVLDAGCGTGEALEWLLDEVA